MFSSHHLVSSPHAESQRVRKLLRAAQRSIMILDPCGAARKPPKESVSLLLAVDRRFGLSDAFRSCVAPDYLTSTVSAGGASSRASVERSYDWFLPILSRRRDVVSRLPPDASCFLLSRACDDPALASLAAPLLEHVRRRLTTTGGGAAERRAAVETTSLLLTDLADASPDRRRSARRVLEETVGDNATTDGRSSFSFRCGCGWLFDLPRSEHRSTLVPQAIQHVVRATVVDWFVGSLVGRLTPLSLSLARRSPAPSPSSAATCCARTLSLCASTSPSPSARVGTCRETPPSSPFCAIFSPLVPASARRPWTRAPTFATRSWAPKQRRESVGVLSHRLADTRG